MLLGLAFTNQGGESLVDVLIIWLRYDVVGSHTYTGLGNGIPQQNRHD